MVGIVGFADREKIFFHIFDKKFAKLKNLYYICSVNLIKSI